MKIISDKWQATSGTNLQRARRGSVFSCHPSPVTRHRQRGVALVITLILLSVTLVMALAFLAISGRERGSVTTQTDTATTRLAADTGLAAAEAQIAANILSTTNPYSFGLLVSTNYPPFTYANPADFTNLQFSPRAPVWLTNLVAGGISNRFYLDLNRNGVDDPNGWVLDSATSNFVFKVGDPEWIGVLERPDLPHGPNNHFIARFAFIALPVGNSLDLNAIHNQALSQAAKKKLLASSPIAPDYYARNQGVGSWEINLAAFLTDLNTNEWDPSSSPYNYVQPQIDSLGNLIWGNSPNIGRAFEDAFVLLTNRYSGLYNTLPSVNTLFGAAGGTAFANDYIDGYTDGPLMTNAQLQAEDDIINALWVGGDNTNHYFTPEELFNTNETASFGVNLLNAGTGASSYDRYTFYRMLSQLGTDTAPEAGKMNLNYDNLVQAATNGVVSETNFYNWQPLAFFTNAADRMLKTYTAQWFQSGPSNYLQTYYGISGYTYVHDDSLGNPVYNDPSALGLTNVPFFGMTNQIPSFGVTGIPVWIVGYSNQMVYEPSVQRVLQLAANIYDATTTNYYPSVFRPLFTSNSFGVFVTGYTNFVPIPTTLDPAGDPQLYLPVDAAAVFGVNVLTNVYGVPWIIGAKKGFPNFNKFQLENVVQMTRKLQSERTKTNINFLSNPELYTTSQQLSIVITNMFGVECWNSYRADFTNQVTIYAQITDTMVLTNDQGLNYPIYDYIPATVIVPSWPGYGYGTIPQPNSFDIPLNQNRTPLLNPLYTFNTNTPFVPTSPSYFVPTNVILHWGLQITNRVRVIMLETNATVDPNNFHVIDYAQFIGPDSSHDLSADIEALYDTKINPGYDDQWDRATINGLPLGLAYQYNVSAQQIQIRLHPYWDQQDPTWVTNQTAGFRAFLGYGTLPGMPPSAAQYIAVGKTSLKQQAPYPPTATVTYLTTWEANDPLIHYLASDLTDFSKSSGASKNVEPLTLGVVNDRYWPWGGNPQPPSTDPNPYNRTIKDPLVSSSDNWDFPTNKLPTTGWLGRVHRGTPWQTIYLKSSDVPSTTVLVKIGTNSIYLPMWQYLNGNLNSFDAANTAPVQDHLLFDLFTTAFNDNATRGTLSVNQSADNYDPVSNPAAGLAAWSALFSGVVVMTNLAGSDIISPAGSAGVNSALGTLVTNINYARNNFKNADGLVGVFEHKGDILSAPKLTEQSPFLNGLNPTNQISDAMYEWLPQQTMSLLRVGTPRYVIYSYGQALKPAQGGTYLGAGPFFGMVTNYQVVSEIATRAVVRLDTVRTNANGAISVTPPRAVIESFNILPPD